MTIEELRARLSGDPPADVPHDIFAPRPGDSPAPEEALAEAAVLVPIVLRPERSVLLTLRTAHLSRHAGQVSFPGGRIDPTDADPTAAALREANEEIGLDPAEVEITGTLPTHITGTGYRITPVIGLVRSDIRYMISPQEVDAVFELPFAVLLDPAAPKRQMVESRGQKREFWVWPHPEHFVWGATAAILVALAHRLRGER